ncbi:MAG: hypothetical protein ISP58_06325 [Flavobacteriales bacterium]|nr:hypothetical protein [Flavobacteriales bacterium]
MVKNLQTKYDLYGQTEFFLILVGLGGLLLFVYLTTPSGTFPSILNLNSKLKKKTSSETEKVQREKFISYLQKQKKYQPNYYEEAIKLFIKKMKKIPQWYEIIQKRGNGHAMLAKTINIKVDNYKYWAKAHKEEYILRFKEGNLDVEGINLRIEKFKYIVTELEKIIKISAAINKNITQEMHNDYCAARASLLGAEYALKAMKKNN